MRRQEQKENVYLSDVFGRGMLRVREKDRVSLEVLEKRMIGVA